MKKLSPSTRRQLYLLAGLAVVLILAVVKWGGKGSSDVPVRAAGTSPQSSASGTGAAAAAEDDRPAAARRPARASREKKASVEDVPFLTKDMLNPPRPRSGEGGRNIFDPRQPSPTPPPTPTPPPPPPPVPGSSLFVGPLPPPEGGMANQTRQLANLLGGEGIPVEIVRNNVPYSPRWIADLRGVAIVTVDAEGKSHVESPGKIVGLGAASGALWGMLIGLLFFVPFLGAALGGAMGALFGKLAKSGINDTFRQQVQELLQPGKAAVVIMAEKITEDKFADRMAPYGSVVWVQDYQLQLVPAMLRGLRPDLRIGFFLHIPFPPVELFVRDQLPVGLLRKVGDPDIGGVAAPIVLARPRRRVPVEHQ